MITAIPQAVINWNFYGVISPWINNENLFAKQLMWGLEYSRYATFIGSEQIHEPNLYFIDPDGSRLADEWESGDFPLSVYGYCSLALQHFLTYIAIVVRHICNAVFILFPEQYIFNLDKNLFGLALLSLIIAWLFIILFIHAIQGLNLKKDIDAISLLVALVLPSVVIMFGAVEERFLVLPYMLIYGFLAFYDYADFNKTLSRKKIIGYCAGFVLFAFVMISVEEGILNSLADYPLSFMG